MMVHDAERDLRMPALYDAENRWAIDDDAIRASLEDAGFCVDELYGGWRGEPPDPDGSTGELVVVARA